MGKRSGFARLERDFYPTPFAAVPPLIPHLRGIRTFAEPCAGDGALVRHLETFELRCVYAGDISTGRQRGGSPARLHRRFGWEHWERRGGIPRRRGRGAPPQLARFDRRPPH